MFKIFSFVLLTAIVFGGLSACKTDTIKKKEIDEKPIAVTLSTVAAGTQREILASGIVEAIQTANISTRVMGRITNIYVKTGDKVNKGQLLARVSDEDLRAKRAQTDAMIAEAEGALVSAQKDYDRFNNLYSEQSATAKELDNATLQFSSAKARVAAARQMRTEINANLSYSSLIAPFTGVVTQKLAEAGDLANPGMSLLTVEQNGILQVSASIAESDIGRVHVGDLVKVRIKSNAITFKGKVIQVNPSSQFTGGQYIIKISIPDTEKNDIYAGMYASVSIPVTESVQSNEETILVPTSAIVDRNELKGIYTVSVDNRAMLRWIRLGKIFGDKVEVISGLAIDEMIVNSSESRLYNGAQVIIKDPAATANR